MAFWLISVICYGFCKCHDQGANLLTSALLELKSLTLKNQQCFFYQVSDQPTLKSIALVGFGGSYIYVDKI